MDSFEYAMPEKIEEIFEYMQVPGAVLKAGGNDLLDLMKEEILVPKRLVNIRDINELKFIKEDDKMGLVIGPNMTLADLAKEEKLQGSFQALAQAAASAALPQIRNSATLGGNLCQHPRCWYFRSGDFPCARKGGDQCFALDGENQYHAIFGNSDGCAIVHPSATAVALMALDAKLQIRNKKNSREINISEFFTPPAQDVTRENILEKDEIISEIIIPTYMKDYKSYYFKQKEKQAHDWPIADVAVALKLEGANTCLDARIVLGSAAPVPWRVEKAEVLLKNATITKEQARKAAQTALEGAEPLSLNSYKIPIFKAIIYRTICWATEIDPFI
jgi:xanthine dehydrogenase YagS FAD-binding subunit